MNVNPVLVKEMRTRMRGARSFAILTIYAATLGTILGLFYWAMVGTSRSSQMTGAGLQLAAVAVFVQTALVCLISPTFTAASIASEREQQTFELLVASLATPATILVGKVGASLCYLLLVLFGSLPIVAFLYWIGGVSLTDVWICYLITFVSGMAYCTVSFLWSTLLRRAVLAQMASVATVIVLVIAVPAAAFFVAEMSRALDLGNRFFWDNVAYMMMRTNPFVAQADVLFTGFGPSSGIWLQSVPIWIWQAGFSLGLTALAALGAIKRLASVRRWL